VQERIPHLGTFATMLAGKWRRVEALYIERGKWLSGDMHADLFLHLATWAAITYLDLNNISFPTVATFGRLIFSLPNLEQLKCIDVSFAKTNFDPSVFSPYAVNRSKLWRIELIQSYESHCAIVDYLIGTGIGAKLREFRCNHHSHAIDSAEALRNCQLATATVYKLAVVAKASAEREITRAHAFDFSRNRKLGQLKLLLIVDEPFIDYDWLFRSLATIESGTLYNVYLAFDTRSLEDPRGIRAILDYFSHDICTRIDKLLSRLHFARTLQDVAFSLITSPTPLVSHRLLWSETLQARFPRLRERGIFRTEVYDYNYGDEPLRRRRI